MEEKIEIKDLLSEEENQIKSMEDLVNQALEDEKFLSTKLHEVENDDEATFGQKVSDKVADFGGSWTFIIGFCTFLVFWVIVNTFIWTVKPADPYPFIFLNLILSCIAALQAPIIMMSQNRQEEKDRRRARSDFMINLKAEMEIRNLHDKLDAFQKTHEELIRRLTENKNI
ncbi:DUF1003 domain-containing protein [Bacteriovorax sp. PP10]|uniref:DUF1003 domain-containing protein n=1 Tax=Bacteriovorax antarcticus TaxID=3088717 RepID=A0ABU5VZL1_9BACT|nr:DUF1003 domain-containing protein [Bacteriovorax sp. PP10]MEA9357455.1 DUF1003 domain-containing protein [Bacteriovorax sp. PP10]